MEDKYQNKYRIPSTRLKGWDYGSHALYFVTICTKDRAPYFGEIGTDLQGVTSLQKTPIAEIAYANWLNIPQYHPYVELDEFIIMPDHIHGILFINNCCTKYLWFRIVKTAIDHQHASVAIKQSNDRQDNVLRRSAILSKSFNPYNYY